MFSGLAYLCSSTSWGGLELNQLRNALWMHERGHRVFVFCVADTPLHHHTLEMGLSVVLIKRHRKYYDFAAARRLKKALSEHQITHLIIRATRDMSIAASVRFRMGAALHTSYFMEMQLGVNKKNILHQIRQRYIDLWSCPLPYLRQQVKSMTAFKGQTVIIPSGLVLSEFQTERTQQECREELNLPSGRIIFGLIGRFDPQKGQQLALQAFEKLENDAVDLVFLGEPTLGEADWYYQSIKDEIKLRALEERVFIRPFRQDTVTFYKAIDVLIMATKAESIGMVTLEALACGTPVLGSNKGGTPEILAGNKGGLLFLSQNVEDLSLQMRAILEAQDHFSAEELQSLVAANDHHKVCTAVENALNLSSPESSQSL